MIKGTTKIELTDVHTGEVQSYTDDNMVTNALRDLFRPLGLCHSPTKMFSTFTPYYQTLLGGLLCFDTAIEENPDNYYPPANARLIGCAAYGMQNDTSNVVRGVYNQTESEISVEDRYAKYVYDFATSQGNGTIASICLTHRNAGLTSYGGLTSEYNTVYPLGVSFCEDQLQYVRPYETGGNTGSKAAGFVVGTTELIFLIDRENDFVYYFKIMDTTHIHIIRRKAYLKSVSVFDDLKTSKRLIDEFELAELSTPLMSTTYVSYNYDPATKALYIFSARNSRLAHNETFLVTKVDVETWSATQWTVTNTTDLYMDTSGMWYAFATDGYVYLKDYSTPHRIYKFEISNSANVTMLVSQSGVESIDGMPIFVINGRIYYEYRGNQLYIANTRLNEVLKPENRSVISYSTQYCYTPLKDNPLMYFCDIGSSNGGGYYFMSNYLATINNLSEPVTKTADKTMKITYIIQEQL